MFQNIFRFLKGKHVIIIIPFFFFILANCNTMSRWLYNSMGRDEWQKPEFVIQKLNITSGSKIVDLGSGSGYFTFHLSEAAGNSGKIYPLDVESSNLEYIEDEAKERKISNLYYVLSETNDPKIPVNSVDIVFSCNSYHHIENRSEFFKKVYEGLKQNGKLSIIDYKKNGSWFIPSKHFIEVELIQKEMEAAGFKLLEKIDLPRQNFLIFAK